MFTKKIKNILIALVIIFASTPITFANYLPVQAYATDTIAGYSSLLKTSLVNPNQNVIFVVERPDGTVVQVPAQADTEGIAKTDLYGHQTKIAGNYGVAIVFPGSPVSSPQSSFIVYPDAVSVTQSTMSSTFQMVEAGKDTTFVLVYLYDEYRNPILDHRVKLISSRADDEIQVLQEGLTDKEGRMSFKVKSAYSGISVFTAIDETANAVLDDREEIVFYAPSVASTKSSLSSLFSADIGGNSATATTTTTTTTTPGPVDHFDISGVSSKVKVGEQVTMTVSAQDKNNNTAKNYTGTILISVPGDSNATLPNSGTYTFKASDLGTVTFSLSLQFSKVGNQSIQIYDKSDFKIYGEEKIEVISGSSVSASSSSALSIKSPVDGSNLGSSLVLITGKASENVDLKVFDNDVKIGTTSSDSDGYFSYSAKNLTSGSHTFYVMTDSGDVSSSVKVTVDTVAPVLNSFKMSVEGSTSPSSSVTFTIQSEKNLSSAKIRIQGVEEKMTESSSEPGTYSVTIVAPATDSSYPVDVILVDTLSNKAEFSAKGTLKVVTPAPENPPQVQGFEGVVGDSSVSLSWKPVTGHSQTIQKYRIYYGTLVSNLDKKIDTLDSTAKWELRSLTNGTQYFMAVSAIDSKGIESKDLSVKIAATPVATVVPVTTVTPVATVTPTITPVNTDQIQTVSGDGSVTLTWQTFTGVQAYYYKILMGTSSGNYVDTFITQNNTTSVTITDLINGGTYYFTVAALDINKNQISGLAKEITAIPGSGLKYSAPVTTSNNVSSTGTSPINDLYYNTSQIHSGADYNNIPTYYQYNTPTQTTTTKSGPATLWVMVASVIFALVLYGYKKRIIRKVQI